MRGKNCLPSNYGWYNIIIVWWKSPIVSVVSNQNSRVEQYPMMVHSESGNEMLG